MIMDGNLDNRQACLHCPTGPNAEDLTMNGHDNPMQHSGKTGHPYAMFAVNMVLSLIVMYLVMFSMIDGWNDFPTTSICSTWR